MLVLSNTDASVIQGLIAQKGLKTARRFHFLRNLNISSLLEKKETEKGYYPALKKLKIQTKIFQLIRSFLIHY